MIEISTTEFLSQLKKNNNKPWFDKNKAKYIAAQSDFENFAGKLIGFISSFDEDIKLLEAKKCTFRINRDIRFSKDKTPYKTNMGAYFNRGGKKSVFGGYYFHLEPGGKSFAGGGMWMPPAPELKKIRQEIDYCFPEFEKICSLPAFRKHYGGLQLESDQMLVNVPKEYHKNNPAAEYLRLKSFVAIKKIPDSQLFLSSFTKELSLAFKALMPLVKFMNRALE